MLKNIVKESDKQNKELLTLSNLISKNNNNKCSQMKIKHSNKILINWYTDIYILNKSKNIIL